jgi:hypothetical protein
MSHIGAVNAQQPIQPNFLQNQAQEPELHTSMQDLAAAAKQEAMSVDKEVMFFNKKDLGKLKDIEHGTEQVKDGKKGAETTNFIEQLAALLQDDAVDKKRRKKKTKFEEKLEELAGLEGRIDLSQLPEEERHEFEKLFENMSRIKTVKAKLKQLEDQEEVYENRFEELKRSQKGLSDVGMEEPKLDIPQSLADK